MNANYKNMTTEELKKELENITFLGLNTQTEYNETWEKGFEIEAELRSRNALISSTYDL
jgi:hypothetical protein